MKKFIIKYLPLLVLWAIFLFWGLYGTAIRQRAVYEEYNDMGGTVTCVVVSTHCASVLCDIRLDNGVYGSVNNGYSQVCVGDRWINNISSYHPLFGMSGYAYFIVPKEPRSMIEGIVVLLLLIFPAISMFVWYLCGFIKKWIKTH